MRVRFNHGVGHFMDVIKRDKCPEIMQYYGRTSILESFHEVVKNKE